MKTALYSKERDQMVWPQLQRMPKWSRSIHRELQVPPERGSVPTETWVRITGIRIRRYMAMKDTIIESIWSCDMAPRMGCTS
jgi:hypothetical protein